MMADAPDSRFVYKRRGAKPYDVSHSFVRRVTSSVTQLLPQPAWLSQWFTQSEHSTDSLVVSAATQVPRVGSEPADPPEISEDDGSSDEEGQSVAKPLKPHPRIPLNNTFPSSSFRIHRLNDVAANADDDEKEDDRNHDSEPVSKNGPSGFRRQRNIISSTPATGNLSFSQSTTRRLDTTYNSPILRKVCNEQGGGETLFQSTQTESSTLRNVEEKINGDDDSITSESTSVGSFTVKPSNWRQRSKLHTKKRRIIADDIEDDQIEDEHYLQGPRNLNLERKRARLIQNLNCSSVSQHETTLGSNNPSFNVDVYTSRKQDVSRRSPLSSSFYGGETTYGGASAYERPTSVLQQLTASPVCFPRLGTVEVHPTAESPRVIDTGVSRTARRILDTLQQLSTPSREARGILLPTRSSPDVTRLGPPVRPLNVPSVPELLRLRQKERIQSTMSSARAVASSHKELAQEEYRLGEFQGSSKYVSKMKSRQSNTAFEDSAISVNLPNVPLPITTLPKFDLGFCAVSLATSVPSASSLSSFSSSTMNVASSAAEVEVASPMHTVGVVPVSSVTSQEVPVFTFSQPLDAQDEAETAVLDSTRSLFTVSKSRDGDHNCEAKEGSERVKNSSSKVFNLGSEIKKLAKMQTQVSDTNKKIGEKWQCKRCAMRNAMGSDKCLCGQVQNSSLTETPGFGAQFKLLDGMWECSVCMVRNKNSDVSCIACTTARPIAKRSSSHDTQTCTKSSFGDKFKPPVNSWMCSTCLVQNPENLSQCQACTSKKSNSKHEKLQSACEKPCSSTVDQSTKADGSWYCTVCMACNKPGIKKCTSCDYTNPNSNLSGLQFKFDIPAEASKFKFGIDKAESNITKIMASSACGFTFGVSSKTTTVATTFSFGIPTFTSASVKSQLCNATSTELLSGKTSATNFSASFPSKLENQSLHTKTVDTSRKRSLCAPDEVDDNSATRPSGDRTEIKSDGRKVSFCFEPSKGFGPSLNSVPKQDSGASASTGVTSGLTQANSPFSSPKNNSSTSEVSQDLTTACGVSPGNLTGRVVPVIVKTSADTYISKSVMTSKSENLSKMTSSPSKSCEIIPLPSAVVTFSKELLSKTESAGKKLNATSKETTGYGSWLSPTVSDTCSTSLVPANSTASVTKIPSAGTTAASSASSGAVNVNNFTSVATTSSTAMQKTVSTGSGFSTRAVAVLGAPSTSSMVTTATATSALIFSAAVSPVFSSSTSTIPPASGATTATTTPIFGAPTRTATILGTVTTSATSTSPKFSGTTTSAAATTLSAPLFGAATCATLPVFGAVTTSGTAPMFGKTVAATPVLGATATTPSQLFGVVTTTATASTTITTTSSSFFGVSSTTPPSLFGATNTSPQAFGVTATTAAPVFGANTTSTTTASPPLFGVATTIAPSAFSAITSTAPCAFGSNTGSNTAAVFGGSSSASSFGATAPTPSFGGSGSNFGVGATAAIPSGFIAPTTTATAFGSNPSLTRSFESSPQVFGVLSNDSKSSLSQSSDKPVTPFGFGGNTTGQTTPSQPFQFANNNNSNSISKPDFSFGSANASDPLRPGFGFGSSAQQPLSFGFGSNGAAPATSATLFPAGSTVSTPATGSLFGSVQASGNFVGANAASSRFAPGGFSFGQSNTNVFGFSGAQASVPSASKSSSAQPFQFGQTTPVQFDPNAKPTFNFTGGETPVFTASGSSGTVAPQQRRIKKALRRAHR